MSRRRIGPLTAMRGLAALWVMMFHIDVSLVYRDMGALLPRAGSGLLSKGYLWVDFFFMLSGFVIAHVYAETLSARPGARTILDYLRARLARLYPLHLFCLGLVVLIALAYPLAIPGVEDESWAIFMAWRAIPSNLLMTHAMDRHVYLSWDIVSWSIGAEWWTYIAALPLLAALPRLPRAAVLALALAAFGLLAGDVLTRPERTLDITYRWGFFRCLHEFVIGACLWRCWRDGSAAWIGRDSVLLAVSAAIVALFQIAPSLPGADLLAIPLHGLLLYGLAGNRGRAERWLSRPIPQYVGRISYALYLVHGVVFIAFWFLMPAIRSRIGPPSSLVRWLYAAGFGALALAGAHLLHHHVERPARAFLLGLGRRGRDEDPSCPAATLPEGPAAP